MSEEKEPSSLTWGWKNYFKPTPRNLLRVAEYLKGAFVIINSAAIWESVQAENPIVGIVSILIGYTLDQGIKFFAEADAEQRRVIKVSVDADVPENKIQIEDTIEKPDN